MDAVKHSVEGEYTVEDIYALPEGQRAELIDGRWYDMATPSSTHQRISMVVSVALFEFIKSKGGKCQVFAAPFAVFLSEDGKNYLEPDISVICNPEIIDEKGCHGAPDLVVEIVSPTTMARDLGVKLFRYRMSGVKEYWVVNPELELTTVYWFGPLDEESDEADQIPFSEIITSRLYPELSVVLSELL